MLDLVNFWAWLRASDLNLILDESELRAQCLKVEAQAFQAFKLLVHLSINFIEQPRLHRVC